MLSATSSSLMCLILFELSAWSSHEVTAAQRNHYHQHSGSALQNSLHHHKVAYNLHNFNHHSGAGKSIPLRTSKIDNKFTDNTKNNEDKVASVGSNVNGKNNKNGGLVVLKRLVMESFIEPTFLRGENQRSGKRRTFSEIPSAVGRVFRGLSNLTVAIGRTINSENVGNGSLSRLITNRLVGVSESLMGWVERSVDDLPSIPRLDAQECMKRCICEAHNQPKKYGAVGLVIQLFFPPYLDSENTTKVVSKYQLAARYGRGENANCSAQYDGCMVNVLDVLQGAIDMIF